MNLKHLVNRIDFYQFFKTFLLVYTVLFNEGNSECWESLAWSRGQFLNLLAPVDKNPDYLGWWTVLAASQSEF